MFEQELSERQMMEIDVIPNEFETSNPTEERVGEATMTTATMKSPRAPKALRLTKTPWLLPQTGAINQAR